ncbi:MAG TPA: aminopeptidase [Phycisphaerae bacterium]|nr:aminopeptidase [Phycisphaerae bacterium]
MDARQPLSTRRSTDSYHCGLFLLPAMVVMLASIAGCGFDVGYAIPAVFGQLNIMTNSRSVEEVLAGDQLSPDHRAKLELVMDVRAYARDVIGLYVDNSYTQYFDSGDRPVAYNLSASYRDRFEPLTWWFPIVGTVPQLGYFDPGLVQAKEAELTGQGFDVFVYELDAYYMGPALQNPVTSPLLDREETDLVATVIHELTHATVGRINNSAADASFNESLATFVGRTGAVRYYQDRMPDQPDRVRMATNRFEDDDRYAGFMNDLFTQLDAYYHTDAASEEKIAGRAAIFLAARTRFAQDDQPLMHDPALFDFMQNLPINNAYVLLQHRYNLNLDVFNETFLANAENWAATLGLFRAAAAVDGDPYAFLQNQLNAAQSPRRRAD